MNYSAIIVAAGKGSRSGLSYNKVLFEYEGKPLVAYSIERFLHDSECQEVIVVCAPEELDTFQKLFKQDKVEFAIGGETRAHSVYSGLQKVNSDFVLIHDGARPFLSPELIERVKQALIKDLAIIPGIDVVDTIKEMNEEGYFVYTPRRANLKAVQTPQGFSTSLIRKSLEQVLKEGIEVTDDAMALEKVFGIFSRFVLGDIRNQKVTSIQDIENLKRKSEAI